MKSKLTFFTVLAALMIFALPVLSQAWQGHGPNHGGYMRNSSDMMERQQGNMPFFQVAPEKRDACIAVLEKHRDETWAVKNELSAKRMELEYLSRNAKTEPKAISGLVNDINKLNVKLHDMHMSMAQTMQKDFDMPREQAYSMMSGLQCDGSHMGMHGNNNRSMRGEGHRGDMHHRF